MQLIKVFVKNNNAQITISLKEPKEIPEGKLPIEGRWKNLGQILAKDYLDAPFEIVEIWAGYAAFPSWNSYIEQEFTFTYLKKDTVNV